VQIRKNRLAIIGLAAIFLAALNPLWDTAKASEAKSTVVWAGVGAQKDTIAGFAGGIWSPDGNLDATGILFRVDLLYVDYEFNTGLSPSGKADGDLSRGSASIGYQVAGDGFTASLFGGIDIQDRDINPSVADNGKLDDDLGFVVTGRVATSGRYQYPASIEGRFSTANNDYWAQARIGYRLEEITIGPEGAVLGNDDYNAVRIGAYASFNLGEAILQINAGNNFASRSGSSSASGKDGIYGGATVVFLF